MSADHGRGGNTTATPKRLPVHLDQLPVATIASHAGVFVAVNPAYVALTGWTENDVVGKTMPELLEKLVAPRDRAVIERLWQQAALPDREMSGWLWCRIRTASGEERPVRVEWRVDEVTLYTLIFMLDARPEVFGQEVSEGLARAAGVLSRCSTEAEVLDHAVDALQERGFTATVLIIEEGDPLLRYGPTRSPRPNADARMNEWPRPSRDVLERINPAFMQRRAAFFQDGMRLVREAYSEPVAERVRALLPAEKMVQAPLFLADSPYGALIVTSDALSPIVATAIDLFAELVGKALETVRLRKERVERERLAALGEAAAVMAHEVRNPVGAIMNVLALLERDGNLSVRDQSLLGIISEETARLEHLVTQLLDLGRPLFPKPCAYAMEDLTRRAVRLLTARGELSDRMLHTPTDGATMAWMDPDLAELALLNVLRNAAQSTSAKGNVRVSIEVVSDMVRCIVDDDGDGISEDVSKKLGQPFVTTRAMGTGMGLAVVRRILEASAGRLSVARPPAGGARVVLEFPRAT
jgi:PAS domain S-box-containing protein